MNFKSIARHCLIIYLAVFVSTAHAAPVEIDAANPANGITDIFSRTFDGLPLLTPNPDPFFGVVLPLQPGRAIELSVNPTTVADNVVPGGFTVVQNGFPPGFTLPPAPGSFLDLELTAGNTMVTLAGGTITVPGLNLLINEGQASETTVIATDAGILFNPIPVTVPVDGNGIAVIEIDPPSVGVAADFSTFSEIIPPGGCNGSLCPVIPALTLDMLKVRLVIDYDPTFTSFTSQFTGQTSNLSMVFATLDSVLPEPEIDVTDSVAPAGDLSVPFADTEVGMTLDETITVTNNGNATLSIGTVTNPAAPFVKQVDNCTGQAIAPAGTCEITVRFAPSAAVTSNSSLDIPSNDADESTVTVSLSGTGTPPPAPEIEVTDSVAPNNDLMVPFGTVFIGNTPTRTVTVANSGNANLVIGNVAQANPLATPFSIQTDNCSGQAIAPAGNCTVIIQYTPSVDMQADNDSFDIPSNDADEASVAVMVSGTASMAPVPDIDVTDSVPPTDDLDVPFGNVETGMTSDQDITVTNIGNADLDVTAISTPAPPFSILSEDCTAGPVAQGGGTCTINVRFAPAADGPNNSSVVIMNNDNDETVTLSGTGFTPAPEITVTDSVAPTDDLSIPFGTQTVGMTPTETVTVTNDGTANLVIGTIGQVQALAAPFTVQADNCSGQTVAPAGNCTIEIMFAPGSAAAFNDSIDIPSDDADEASVVVAVSGTGSVALLPDISVTDTVDPADDLAIPFGDVTQDFTSTQTVTVTNDGAADLVIGTVAVPAAPYGIAIDSCSGQTIAPMASCGITVEFTPTALGNAPAGSLDIPSNDPDTPTVSVGLSGNGVEPQAGDPVPSSPDGADGGFFGLSFDPQSLLALFLLIPMARAHRRRVGARRSNHSMTRQ